MEDTKTIKNFSKAVSGWAIDGIQPCQQPESLFTLVLSKDGQTKKIDLFATDLGWWFNATGQHQWMKWKATSVPICHRCNLFEDDPKASLPCGGYTTDAT